MKPVTAIEPRKMSRLEFFTRLLLAVAKAEAEFLRRSQINDLANPNERTLTNWRQEVMPFVSADLILSVKASDRNIDSKAYSFLRAVIRSSQKKQKEKT